MGDYLQKVNGSPAGLALYEEAFAIHKSLRQTHPNNIGVLDDLCWSYERMSYVHEELGELEKAKEFRQSRLALARTLLNQSQDRALSQYNMAWAHARMVRPESDPDDVLSATYLALGHAREAIQREPDRLAFREALQHLLRMRAEAVIAYYGVEAGRPLLYEMLVETDNLASSNLNDPMLLERQVTNRLRAAKLLLDHHAPADAARLASQTLGLANVLQRWSLEDNETEESVRCQAVIILEESARRLGRPLQPTVRSDDAESGIVNLLRNRPSRSSSAPVDDGLAEQQP
jgi:tetratricopeptide (TPR) repeat protein